MNRYRFNKEKHIHYLNDKELMGTSTVLGIVNKPLAYFASSEALKPFGWTKTKIKVRGKYQWVPREERLNKAELGLIRLKKMVRGSISTESIDSYLKFLDTCYHAHNKVKDKAADEGTKRHEILETYVKTCIETNSGVPIGTVDEIKQFCEWAEQNIKKFLWSEVHGYSEALWTGGIADVGWEDKEGNIVAGDFKSSKEDYFTHYLQIAGYDIMLQENGGLDAQGNRTFELPGQISKYCIIPFGQEILKPTIIARETLMSEIDPALPKHIKLDFRDGFRSALNLYFLDKLYNKIKKANYSAVGSPKVISLSEALAV